MARLLLLMSRTTYKAQSFLEAATRLGLETVVGSDTRQVLQALHPDGHLTLDLDAPETAAGDIVRFAARLPLDAIVSTDDDAALVAAQAAAALGLPHHPPPAVVTARDKRRTRAAQAAVGLRHPAFVTMPLDGDPESWARRLRTGQAGPTYPCVLKPLHLSASRGVIRADDEAAFAAAVLRLQAILRRRDAAPAGGGPAREILIEGFVPGFEVALEGLVTGGRLQVLALFDKPDRLDGPFFEETIYVTPSRHAPELQAAIEAEAARNVAALGLRHGPVHAELRCDGRHVVLIEMAPRSIGGLCSRAVRFAGGESLEMVILAHALGTGAGGVRREAAASGVLMLPIPRAGILRGIAGTNAALQVEDIEDLRLTIPIGQPVEPPPEGSRYLGFLFARAATPERVEAALRQAHARLRFDIDPVAVDGTTPQP
jgi:biotin carboxylase